MIELEPRTLEVYGEGTKAFVTIEGWNLKDVITQDGKEYTIRNNLVHKEWLEASKDKDLFTPCVVMAWLHYIDLIVSNPDYLWRYIYYRKEQDARTHNLPTT